MNNRLLSFSLATLLVLALAACDSGPVPPPTAQPTIPPTVQPTQEFKPTPQPAPTLQAPVTRTIVDAAPVTPPPTEIENIPSPTPVTATSTGEMLTALQALATLKPRALEWQADVRLAMLANVRPGQQKLLLGGTLGDPDIFEPTPGGKGRNWTLVAVSPTRGAVAISMDGTLVDLLAEGAIVGEALGLFADPQLAVLELSRIDPSALVDSDKLAAGVPVSRMGENAGIALIAPDGLGLGPLPTPQTRSGPAHLAYELYSASPSQQSFIIFDAQTGAILLDSATP